MASIAYYDILQAGLPQDLTVAELIHGVSWTAAVLSDGRYGVAMHTTGETVPRMFGGLIGLPLNQAGQAMLSWNMEEASEAFAAVNAFYNHPGCGYVKQHDAGRFRSRQKAVYHGPGRESRRPAGQRL